MKTIELSRGQVAFVDDQDYEWLNRHKWAATLTRSGLWYAHRYVSFIAKKYKRAYMHREILGLTNPKVQVDHENGNGLDNQRQNLRQATPTQNMGNRRKSKHCSSIYKGVHLEKKSQKWRATLRVKWSKNKIELGRYRDEKDAARAYNAAAEQYFGKFANLNVLVQDSQ